MPATAEVVESQHARFSGVEIDSGFPSVGDSLTAMRRYIWLFALAGTVHAQTVENAADLLQKAKVFGESTLTWRAETVEKTRLSGPKFNLQNEVHTKIAAEPLLKMSRQNSGDDKTVMVCDGTNAFYSGDGHSYYEYSVQGASQCSLRLQDFYQPFSDLVSAEVIGKDRIVLAEGDRQCVVVRAVFKQGTTDAVRTMCIDSVQPIILRDVFEGKDEKSGVETVRSITFVSFEDKPTFAPNTFQFTVPPGAIEVKPPQ